VGERGGIGDGGLVTVEMVGAVAAGIEVG